MKGKQSILLSDAGTTERRGDTTSYNYRGKGSVQSIFMSVENSVHKWENVNKCFVEVISHLQTEFQVI